VSKITAPNSHPSDRQATLTFASTPGAAGPSEEAHLSEPAVAVERLTKRYAGAPAVDDVSFRVTPGEIVAVLGVNGAGKTTLLECAVGLRRPDRGSTRLMGVDPRRHSSWTGAACGVALQDGGVWPAVTAREALGLHAALHAEPWPVSDLLATVGLADAADRRVRTLSGGQRQRLGVAMALVGRPGVLVLDEPTGGMDLPGRERLWALLRQWRDAGAAVLMSTHLREEAEQLADRVAVLHHGRLAAVDRPAALVAAAGERLEVAVRGDVDADTLAATFATGVERLGAGRLRIDAGPHLVPRLTAWLADQGLVVESVRTGGLADVLAELQRDQPS